MTNTELENRAKFIQDSLLECLALAFTHPKVRIEFLIVDGHHDPVTAPIEKCTGLHVEIIVLMKGGQTGIATSAFVKRTQLEADDFMGKAKLHLIHSMEAAIAELIESNFGR